MMSCDEADRFLDAYLDGELEAAKRAELEEHLAGCAVCQEKLRRLSQFRSFLTANAPHYPAPPGLKNKVIAKLEVQKKSNIIALTRQPWLYAAALAIIGLSVAWLASSPNQEKQIPDQAVANFTRAALLQRACAMDSPEPPSVQPWFNRKLDFTPPVV